MKMRLGLALLAWVTLASGAEDDQTRVDALIAQLADSDNATLRCPGAELMELPPSALPALRAALSSPALSWWTRAGLRRAVGEIEGRADGTGLDAAVRPAIAFYQRSLLGRWRASGKHDPRWDADVETCLAAMAREWSFDPRRRGDELEVAQDAADRAIAAGCSDPYVFYLAGRARQVTGSAGQDEIAALLQRAADGIAATAWHPIDRAFVLLRGAETVLWAWKWHPLGDDLRQVQAWTSAIPDLLVEAARDGAPIENITFLADSWVDLRHRWSGDRERAFRELDGKLRAGLAGSPLPGLAAADFHRAWAWDARGSGWAKSVTEEGWRLMKERMALSQEAIAEAGRLAPDCIGVPLAVLDNANGASLAPDEVLAALGRVMELRPNHINALVSVQTYLSPRWHGTTGQFLGFGRHCLALGDWANGTPWLHVAVVRELGRYGKEGISKEPPPGYYGKAEVWPEIEAAFTSMLARHPDDRKARSAYLWYAHAAGRFDIARQQDAALAGRPRLDSVGSRKHYVKIKEELAAAIVVP